jgi:hypothetical protein
MMGAMDRGRGLLVLDERGRVRATAAAEIPPREDLARAFEALVCAQFSVIGARTVDTPNGYLGILTLRERSGTALEFSVGVALRPDPATALCDAAIDAVLGPWQDSVIAAGAAHLVTEGTCRAAMVIDDTGVATYGSATDFPRFGVRGMTPEPGSRLAVRTPRGEFRALSLGGATVMLNMVPGAQNGRRIERWFDALEDAHT